jgi:hypothetical protein
VASNSLNIPLPLVFGVYAPSGPVRFFGFIVLPYQKYLTIIQLLKKLFWVQYVRTQVSYPNMVKKPLKQRAERNFLIWNISPALWTTLALLGIKGAKLSSNL